MFPVIIKEEVPISVTKQISYQVTCQQKCMSPYAWLRTGAIGLVIPIF